MLLRVVEYFMDLLVSLLRSNGSRGHLRVGILWCGRMQHPRIDADEATLVGVRRRCVDSQLPPLAPHIPRHGGALPGDQVPIGVLRPLWRWGPMVCDLAAVRRRLRAKWPPRTEDPPAGSCRRRRAAHRELRRLGLSDVTVNGLEGVGGRRGWRLDAVGRSRRPLLSRRRARNDTLRLRHRRPRNTPRRLRNWHGLPRRRRRRPRRAPRNGGGGNWRSVGH
mmetsp:Transcript_126201/g.365277  ORF Transcript_126201/g.365277 Transcript_126201/m.365277 type:complete len:221 (+) Transcript_126201:912-1574(+)